MTPPTGHERTEAVRNATPQRRSEAVGGTQSAVTRPEVPPVAAAVLGLQRSIGNQATVRALRSADRASAVSPLVLQRKPLDTPGGEDSAEMWSAVGELVNVYNRHTASGGGSSTSKHEVKEPVSKSGGGTDGGAPMATTWERGKYALNQSGGGGDRGTSMPIGQQRRAFNFLRSGTGAGPSAPQDEVAGTLARPGAGAEPLAPRNGPLTPANEPEVTERKEQESPKESEGPRPLISDTTGLLMRIGGRWQHVYYE